ncbi:phenoloxidase-activating factor 3 isoform X1 [Zeugodacus cucurbitae]|uniref:phenoloxidase-activating factor 3 isoform X1 n=1 Tax=Zeugodacus cucurbitae TaxID=28588 RepID=UPI000596AD23|nr:phenoloxidase-activating factor 3 isoform X1 [Zeugodacus cucurbitae]
MAGLKPSLFACFLLCCCCCNVFTVAYQRYCRENGIHGQCGLYENCETLRGIPLTDEMRNNTDCANSGLSGDVVCCLRRSSRRTTRTTTRRIVYTTATTPASLLEKEYINPRGLALLNQNKCGSLNNDRVANGIDAKLGEFPWSALLLYAEKKPLCGGSVITDRFVLTAAHCIRDDLQLVRLGEHDLSTAVDCAKICQTYEEFGIDPQQKPFIHPDYDDSTKYKDIALIKLDRTIDFQTYNHIKPICLPITPSDYNLVPRAILVLAGWGLTEKNERRQAEILQKGLLRFEPLDVCKELYPLYTVDNSKLCIKSGSNHTVSCQGDSGSPIFWKTRYSVGRFWRWHYTQIGLVSLGFGGRCGGLTERPFMYENVTDSLAWLTNTILK